MKTTNIDTKKNDKTSNFINTMTEVEEKIKNNSFKDTEFNEIEKEFMKLNKENQLSDNMKKKYHQMRRKVSKGKSSWDLMKEDILKNKELKELTSLVEKIDKYRTENVTKKAISEIKKDYKAILNTAKDKVDTYTLQFVENEFMKKFRVLEKHATNQTVNKVKYKSSTNKKENISKNDTKDNVNDNKESKSKSQKSKKTTTTAKKTTNTNKIKAYTPSKNNTSNNDDNFGKWLKETRLSKKLTLKDLESSSGVSSGYIHQIESGKTQNPSIKIVEKLSTGLNVDTTEVLQKLQLITPSVSNFQKNASENLFDLVHENNISINGLDLNEDQKLALMGCLHFMFDDTKDVTSVLRFFNQISNLHA